MKKYAIILAGGNGTRLWPLSRKSKPKQFLNLYGEDSMIVETIKRIKNVIPRENIFIVTNKNQEMMMKEHTRDIMLDQNIIVEPEAKSTAASIGYAITKIRKLKGEGTVCVFSSDHYIEKQEKFENNINESIKIAEENNEFICIGIKPTYPATNFGYIKTNGKITSKNYYNVNKFVEKPNEDEAKQYLKEADFFWNTGIVIASISTFFKYYKEFMTQYYFKLINFENDIGRPNEWEKTKALYKNLDTISISRAILEKAKDIKMVEGNFIWMDIGSLDALSTLYKKDKFGNSGKGKKLNINSKNCITVSNKKSIVTLGVNDLIIIDTEDTILVCSKKNAQDIKQIASRVDNIV